MAQSKIIASLILGVALTGTAFAQGAPGDEHHGGPQGGPGPQAHGPQDHGPQEHGPQGHGGPDRGEAHEGPRGYQRLQEPSGWNNRPAQADRGAYQHNFRAARAYHVGPYRRPRGWAPHHWGFGQILPRPYWASQYLIADYWLFGLEVPPAGYEWVRDDTDALLVNTSTGEILQVEYGVFG